MKYEFKPFFYEDYLNDLAGVWKPTFRSTEEYPDGAPRDVEIVDLGLHAHPMTRFASIDLREHGKVRHHDVLGRFDPERGGTCLDLILYREVGPKPREICGTAYVSEKGQVVTVSPDYCDQEAENCKAVRCTITLHSQEHEPT